LIPGSSPPAPPDPRTRVNDVKFARLHGASISANFPGIVTAVAAHSGIPAFGTLALLHVLVEENALPDTLRDDVKALAAGRVVDLLLTTEETVQLAAADGWQPTMAAVNLARSAFWICREAALDSFLHVIDEVQAHQPSAVIGWLAAACQGLAGTTPAPDTTEKLRELAGATADRLNADPPTRAAMLQVADTVAHHANQQ